MIKKIAVAVSAAAIATAGFAAFGAGTANAANEDIDCVTIKAKVAFTPALTLTPVVVQTSITGKIKDCTASGVGTTQVKGGTIINGSIVGTEPGSCDIGELAGPSETDINIGVAWKTKPGGALADTNINFTNRDGFTLPGATGTSNITGTGAGKQVEVIGDASASVGKIIKKCYGSDNAPGGKEGKGVTKIKVAGTYTSS
jgi:hypothetical protein